MIVPNQNVVIVLDTNYLLDHCDFIRDLLAILADNFLIYVPYVVIQELDGLKLNPSLKSAAIKAISFLFENIGKNSRITGEQSSPDGLLSGDDLIIESCRKIALQLSPFIVLLSNDKNLCVKAVVHGIRTFSNYTGSPKQMVDEILGTQSNRKSMDMSVENENFTDNEMELDSSGDELFLILTDLNAALVGCLSASLKKLFIQRYSLDWEDKTKRYPWTLSDIIQLLNNQIFILHLLDAQTKSNLNYFKRFALDLERSLRREKSMFTKGDLTKFLDQIEGVLALCEHAEFPNDKIQAKEILNNLKIKVHKL